MYAILNNDKDKVVRTVNTLPKMANSLVDGSLCRNLSALSDSDLRDYGFYVITEIKPAFDSEYEILIFPNYQDIIVSGNDITATYKVGEKISLDNYKLTRRDEIKNLKDLKLLTFDNGSNVFQTRQEDLTRISGVHTFLNSDAGNTLPAGFSWTDIDNNEVVMNEAEFITFAEGIHIFHQTVFNQYKTHWTAIQAETAFVDVRDYDINIGW